jgi:hypothetical protein
MYGLKPVPFTLRLSQTSSYSPLDVFSQGELAIDMRVIDYHNVAAGIAVIRSVIHLGIV